MQGGQRYWFHQLIAVLPFSCSCSVSSSPSEVWQFKFECCPQVQEISSAVHYLPWFGGGFSPCLFTGISILGVCYFAPLPFSGAGSVFHQPPLCLWVLLNGSGNELCDLLPALLCGVASCLPTLCLPTFPVLVFTDSWHWDYLLASPPFSSALSAFPPSLVLC
jgi:hypothetical protein